MSLVIEMEGGVSVGAGRGVGWRWNGVENVTARHGPRYYWSGISALRPTRQPREQLQPATAPVLPTCACTLESQPRQPLQLPRGLLMLHVPTRSTFSRPRSSATVASLSCLAALTCCSCPDHSPRRSCLVASPWCVPAAPAWCFPKLFPIIGRSPASPWTLGVGRWSP